MTGRALRLSTLPVLAACFIASTPAAATAQTRASVPLAPATTAAGGRPVPGPVYEIPEFSRAVDRGTRTRTGAPGPAYWVQHARYTIGARLDPATNRISGHERVVYLNNSPDTIRRIAVYLRQNAFAAGSPRRQEAEITGGVTLGRVVVAGREMPPAPAGGAADPGRVLAMAADTWSMARDVDPAGVTALAA